MSKATQKLQMVLFLTFIALFFLLNLFLPDKDFSDRENRYLQKAPAFSFSSLFSGRFTADFETYTTDQFAFRDSWTTLKARSELAVGKKENNGVYYCLSDALPGGSALIERFEAPPEATVTTGINAINSLVERADCPVYLALIPGAAEIWKDSLPDNAPTDSQKELIDYVYERTGAVTVDMYDALSSRADEYIFYRTDHHWTSLGASYAFGALMEAMGTTPPLSRYDVKTVSDEFYGTIYSKSGFSWFSPDSMQAFVDEPPDLTVTNYPQGTPVASTLYDEDALAVKDKYTFFLGGNTPLLRIETGHDDAPSLLIVRDSFADSLAPFLLENFSEIHLLDLRYYRTSLAAYLEENDIDNVLICYSVFNFCTDTNLFLLGR